jgi:CDP-L-myo-inositol myo-inositolphosphotransferase
MQERPAQAQDWLDLREKNSVRKAENAFFAALTKETDGYIARFDRKISTAFSRLLLKTPITPNQITAASLVLGLVGAALLAFGSYAGQVLGAGLLWFCCILDGCDGEVARLKLICSPSGADFDLGADHIAHLAIFLAIPFAVRSADPAARVLLPGALMVSGMILSMITVWWLFLRRPEDNPGAARIFFERIASRDYVYLIFALVLIGKLNWFLWASAFGVHAFNLALWLIFLVRKPKPRLS